MRSAFASDTGLTVAATFRGCTAVARKRTALASTADAGPTWTIAWEAVKVAAVAYTVGYDTGAEVVGRRWTRYETIVVGIAGNLILRPGGTQQIARRSRRLRCSAAAVAQPQHHQPEYHHARAGSFAHVVLSQSYRNLASSGSLVNHETQPACSYGDRLLLSNSRRRHRMPFGRTKRYPGFRRGAARCRQASVAGDSLRLHNCRVGAGASR